jgi:hypothetical protein
MTYAMFLSAVAEAGGTREDVQRALGFSDNDLVHCLLHCGGQPLTSQQERDAKALLETLMRAKGGST